MNKKSLLSVVAASLAFYASLSIGAVDETQQDKDSNQYLSVRVENVVFDTDGLVRASNALSYSIASLSVAIDKLSKSDTVLGAEEKQALMSAVKSVDNASQAISKLATQIPDVVQKFSDQLPNVVRDAQAPIAEITSGIQSTSDGIVAITQSLPMAIEKAKELVNATLDSMLIRVSIFVVVLFAVLSLGLIFVVATIYKRYFEPVLNKLDALVGAPEHFSNLSKYMKETSENLLAIENSKGEKNSE